MSSTKTTPWALEALDDQLVVDDLVVAVHGRLEGPHHPRQRLDRHLDAGAEAAGLGEQHPVDVHAAEATDRAPRSTGCVAGRPVAWTAMSAPRRRRRRARVAGRRAGLRGRRRGRCAVNGQVPRDVIEWRFARRRGRGRARRPPRRARARRSRSPSAAGEPLGAEVSSARCSTRCAPATTTASSASSTSCRRACAAACT